MDFISDGTLFYIIDNLILPLGSTFGLLILFLVLSRQLKQDQIDIFYNGKFMEPKKAKAYLAQIRKEKIEKEFEALMSYQKLFENHRKEYMKLRESGVGIKEIISTLNPTSDEDKK